jgi:phosphoribosylanthranilate isomerase
VAVLVDPDDRLLERIVTAVEPELIQLHGCETPDRVAQIARTFARPVIKVLSVQVAADAEGAAAYAGLVQHVLFDAKPPTSMADPLPGGNGLSFDWRLLVGMRHRFDFILSGGLTPDNVADAVRLTDAYAVDVASGVEVAPGEKSPELIGRFLAAAKSAPATV